MPPLILSPSFNSTGSVSAPPNLTISGIMSAASGVFSGNVGIGTGSPNLQLTLTGSLLLFNNSSGIHQNIYYNSGWKYSTNGYGWAISDIGSGSLAFQMAPNNTAGAGATATVSQPVVITNSGNVGIGTTSPTNMLDIVGQYAAQFSGYQVFTTWRDTNDANKGFRIQTAGGNTLFSTDATGSGTYTERLRITSSGNVGIGTSSPDTYGVFSVYGSNINGVARFLHPGNTAYGTVLTLETYGGSDSPSLSFKNYNGGSPVSYGIATNSAGALTFNSSANITGFGNERMRITSDGKVGIGTNSPTCSLDVQGSWSTGNGPFLQLKNTSGATPGSFGPGIILSNSVAGKSNFMIQQYQDASSAFSINKYDSPYTSYFAISQTGNVGIGTYTPSQTLDVVGNIQLKATAGNSTFLVIDAPVVTGGSSTIIFRTNGSDKWHITSYQADNRLYITDGDSNDGVSLSQNSTSWTANSDLRLKNVQGTITNALDKVQQLTGVKFKWKRESNNPDAKVRVGLIAQDVQAVLPEAVDDDSPDLITDEETGKVSGGLGVRYTELAPLLVNAIKELTARVVALESQISSGAA